MNVTSGLEGVRRISPLRLVSEKALDLTLRPRYFPRVQFAEPAGDQGWFGRDSAVWYVHEHFPALAIGLGAAATIETLHPDFAWMGYDHTRAVMRDADGVPTGGFDPEGLLTRGGHSFAFFAAVAYGPSASAERVTRAVSGMHHRVRGVRPDGRAYDADDPETLRWAYATVVWGIAEAHERYHLRPLHDIDSYYAEFVRVGEALGGTDLPATKRDVADYLERYVPLMGVTPPTVETLKLTDPRLRPLPLRPMFESIQWTLFDLQPQWAQELLRFTPGSRVERTARRTAMKSLMNVAHYGAGPIDEVRQARKRAGAGAPASAGSAPARPGLAQGLAA